MKLTSKYNLAVINPKLAQEWHPLKNGKLTPKDVTPGIHKKVWWKCKNGHEWQATISNRSRGRGCMDCFKQRKIKKSKKTAERYFLICKDIALKKKGKLLSEKSDYKNSISKLKWKCQKGHAWEDTYNHVSRGIWCPICKKQKKAQEKSSQKIREYNLFAKKKGGRCLSEEYVNDITKIKWRCQKGHVWVAIPYSVVVMRTWCPICAGNVPHTMKRLNEIASARGGKCLSGKYVNTDTKYLWECSLGHRWKATFNKIQSGQWCPTCIKSGISEEVTRTIFEEIFGVKFHKYRPKWLKNNRGYQMELDGYSRDLKIAFEYQGRQHFEVLGHYVKTEKALKQRKTDDRRKLTLCKRKGIKLFIIDYKTSYSEIPGIIKKQSEKLNIKNIKCDFNKKINLDKAYVREDRLLELEKIAKMKGGKLLSKKWLGVKEKYKFKCNKDGNVWRVTGSEVLGGAWCKKCSMKKLKEKHVGSMKDLVSYAKQYGGTVLSKKYLFAQTEYKFQCKKGHVFEAKFNNLKYRKQWCPICENRTIKTPSGILKNYIIQYAKKNKEFLIADLVEKTKYNRGVINKYLLILYRQNYLDKRKDGRIVYYFKKK